VHKDRKQLRNHSSVQLRNRSLEQQLRNHKLVQHRNRRHSDRTGQR
jgi:hypothetical protein